MQHRVPIDEALVLVEQPVAIELHEDLHDGARQAFIEREALARPVAGGAEPLQLLDDLAAGFRLPFPDALEEFLATQLAAVLLALHELALDDHLRGDAGVIGARLPQHVLALHAVIAHENILQRIVERMAHMQAAGDVRRRNDDGIGRGVARARAARRESACASSHVSRMRALDGAGVEGFFHGHRVRAACSVTTQSLPRLRGRADRRSRVGSGIAA